MVTIIGYSEHLNEDEEPFYALRLQGAVETVKSTETGKYYATARETTIPSTFDGAKCEALIGKQLPGSIDRVPCEKYEYELENGEKIILEHTWEYNPTPVSMEEEVFENRENGVPV
ncbi:hypothetical protein ACG2F4_05165 [Halalkalibaculum sp. DA3122]|uniref:hypothetical protein n=1 Tax=Halalkalibaculum sp. DA3122 TaxID=3373607 RepID=UPI0037542C75